MNLEAFCKLLYGDTEDGWLTLNFFPNKDTQWFRVGSEPPVLPKDHNCYLGLGVRNNKLDKGRGALEDIIAIPGLWLDLDYESDPGTHKAVHPLPPNERAALDLLEEAPHPPNLVINSGHGIQAYWLFNEPWYLQDDDERIFASQLNAGWQEWFKAKAGTKGWHVDSTADLTRVFRIPGTLNFKAKPYQEVAVVSEFPVRYEPSDFEQWRLSTPIDEEPEQQGQSPPERAGQFGLSGIQRLSERIKYLILFGDPFNRYPSRSEAVFAAINGLIGAGCQNDEIVQIMMDPNHRLSELPQEKGERWVFQEITRAHVKTATRPKNPDQEWRTRLLVKKNGEPTTNVGNIGLVLQHHEMWQGRFWWDSVRGRPMLNESPLQEEQITAVGQWLCIEERLSVSNLRPVENCILSECIKNPKDILQEEIFALPAWDGKKRLPYWLSDVTESACDAYGASVSRIIPLSMIARALDPGCLYRYVVILEGDEDTGKSTLVRELAGQDWYVELTLGFESKEAHMMLQGAWVAELAELDSMSRTEETRLKAFITTTYDTWIPKYSNLRVTVPRRTIFIGTTNDQSYLKGQTGNTRFLPIKTKTIHIERFREIREQILAEALFEYQKSPSTWWQFPEDALARAEEEREERRIINAYEEALETWLEDRPDPNRPTSWPEIAEQFLKLEPGQWKDKSLQMQIVQALKTLGWRNQLKREDKKVFRRWIKG